MRNRLAFIIAIILISAVMAFGVESDEGLASKIVSEDKAESAEAISGLRAKGYEGLNLIFSVFADEISEFERTGDVTETWKKISAAIDAVSMQKDAYAGGLYWHTDLESALGVARSADIAGKMLLAQGAETRREIRQEGGEMTDLRSGDRLTVVTENAASQKPQGAQLDFAVQTL